MKQQQLQQVLKKKMKSVKQKNFYILLDFLLITIALLIVVNIYC